MPTRVWYATCTLTRTYFVGGGTRELGLKRRRGREHIVLRRRRGGSGPRRNVLVERRSLMKHVRQSVTFDVFQFPMSWLNAEA